MSGKPSQFDLETHSNHYPFEEDNQLGLKAGNFQSDIEQGYIGTDYLEPYPRSIQVRISHSILKNSSSIQSFFPAPWDESSPKSLQWL